MAVLLAFGWADGGEDVVAEAGKSFKTLTLGVIALVYGDDLNNECCSLRRRVGRTSVSLGGLVLAAATKSPYHLPKKSRLFCRFLRSRISFLVCTAHTIGDALSCRQRT